MRSRSPFAAAVGDMQEGLKLSPLWWRLSLEQTYNRYRRTLLGPFWIAAATISTGLSLAFVFGTLLGGNWREMLPHILGGVLCWSLISSLVTEGSSTYLGSGGIMQMQRLPLSFYSLLTSTKVVVNFLHQVISFWLVLALFQMLTVPHWSLILAIPLVTVACFFAAVPLAMLSARYRDVGFLVGTLFGAMFMLTPVFWSRAQLPASKQWVVDFNPFAHLLEIVRQPFLGQMAPLYNWYASLAVCAVSAVLALLSLAMFRKRVIFWL